MTVCIAAACEQGSKVVVATDRRISYAGISADIVAAKMGWIGAAGEWLVMYAGEPSNTALILEEIERTAIKEQQVSRGNIQSVIREAYQKRKGVFSSFAALSPYDITLEAFKKNGQRSFGESEFRRISQEIHQAGSYFREQLLVVGWGKAPHAVMIYDIGPDGDRDHRLAGMAAIGSGQEVALSTMMLFGQSRDRALAETLYIVASAKFASEKSQDDDVGSKTAMAVTWKRTPEDDKEKPTSTFLEESQVRQLYKLWLKYGKPKVSEKTFRPAVEIVKQMGLRASVSNTMLRTFMRSSFRKSKSRNVS